MVGAGSRVGWGWVRSGVGVGAQWDSRSQAQG
jgi:hypothetical protein